MTNDTLAIAGQTTPMLELAASLIKSGLIPNSIKTPEAGLVVLLKGRELGMGPMQAFDSIDVIQGKPTLKPQAMLALIYASPHFGSFEVKESTEDACEVSMARKGPEQPAHYERFTIADAKALGLTSKQNWKQQPATMLKWRAIAAAARVVFPDVIQGMYTPEEITAGAQTGLEADSVVAVDVTPPKPAEAPQRPPDAATGLLSRDEAARLHKALGAMGLKGHQQTALAAAISAQDITSFTELTTNNAKAVYAAGQSISEGSSTPKDYGINKLAWDNGPILEADELSAIA